MDNLTRHAELFQPEMLKDCPVHVIGCGATGSLIAFNLVKLGVPEIRLYDMDTIEEHNIANQIYRVNQIGQRKVHALKDILSEHKTSSETKIMTYDRYVDVEWLDSLSERGDMMKGYIFCATDTMHSRKDIFLNAARYNICVKKWIEPRMGLDIFRVYSVDPVNQTECDAYLNTLYDDEEVKTQSACGSTQTALPTANLVAAQCVWAMLADLNHKEFYNEYMVSLPDMTTIKRNFVKR